MRFWYFRTPPFRDWFRPKVLGFWGRAYLFRNKPGVIPGRWGFGFYGFEFGSRNARDPVGLWLKRHGFWPW